MAVAPDLLVGTDDVRTHLRNRVSWGAIFAGAVTALVIQVLINILGFGVGASVLDAANPADNPSASSFSLTAAIWWAVSGILASLAGGIVAGRLSGTSADNTARWHGFVAWCVSTLVVFYLLTSAVGSIVGGTFSALGSTISAAGRGAVSTVSGASNVASSSGAGDALQAQVRQLVNPNDAQSVQDNIVSYIRASISGDKGAADAARDRAVDGLARTANISPDEARARLNQAEQQARQAADQAKQKAQQAAEAARQGATTGSLAVFAALVLGAIAAFIGGGIGAPRPAARVQSRNI